jgi:hypothetical protein
MRRRDRPVTTKEAAYAVMEAAYLKASANGTLPANPRQIMYAARDAIQKATGKPLDSQYFSQTLLVDYVEEEGVDWDIVWDDRGHFREPHVGLKIGLGTLAVRGYFASRRSTPPLSPRRAFRLSDRRAAIARCCSSRRKASRRSSRPRAFPSGSTLR